MESFSVAHRRWFLALILMRVLFSSKGPQPQLAMFRTTSTCGNATCSAAAQGGLLRVSLFLLHRDRSVRDSCASTCSSSFCASHGDSFPSVSSTSRGTTKYIPAKLTAVWLLVKLHLQERGAGGSRSPIIENCWKAKIAGSALAVRFLEIEAEATLLAGKLRRLPQPVLLGEESL